VPIGILIFSPDPVYLIRGFSSDIVAGRGRTGAPYNQVRASRRKMSPGLAERGHGNGPADGKLCGGQAQDLVKARSLRIQRDRQHQPQGLQSSQLAAAAPLFLLTSPFCQQSHKSGIHPVGELLQIRSWRAYPPRNR